MTNTDAGVTDVGTRPRSPTDPAARRIRGLRRNSLGISVMLLAQYGLGMGINLYTPVPKTDQGRGLAVAVGRALSNPPAVLAIHAALGLLLLVAAVNVLARAIRSRQRSAITSSAAGLAAIVGAALSGATFADHGRPGASMAMAILTAVALLCYLLNLFTLGATLDARQEREPSAAPSP